MPNAGIAELRVWSTHKCGSTSWLLSPIVLTGPNQSVSQPASQPASQSVHRAGVLSSTGLSKPLPLPVYWKPIKQWLWLWLWLWAFSGYGPDDWWLYPRVAVTTFRFWHSLTDIPEEYRNPAHGNRLIFILGLFDSVFCLNKSLNRTRPK